MEAKVVKPYDRKQTLGFARTVLEKKFGVSVGKIKYVGGGSYGFVYKAEIPTAPYTVIIKACRAEGMHKNEAAALRKLGESSTVNIPEVYFTFDADGDIPMDFICEEFVEGKDCFTDFSKLFLSEEKKMRFADNVATALGHWHGITSGKFGDLENPQYDNWLDIYKPFAEDVFNTARDMYESGKLDGKIFRAMENAMSHFDFVFSEPVEIASLIHGDLNVMNIMADRNLNITAVIDPLGSKWADREYDLFQLGNLTGDRFHLYETYKRKFGVSEKCDLKCAFYALYNELFCCAQSGASTAMILPMVKRWNSEKSKFGLS